MSTRSTIAIRRLDGSMTKIYCHWDGYIEYNGVILQRYYNTPEKIEELLALGNISSLREKVNPTTDTHSFETPEDNVVVAYHRDRGEEFSQVANEQMEEYNYVFDCWKGAWLVTDYADYPETNAKKFLNIDYIGVRREKLLLDAILECNDEYVDHETKTECMNMAKIGKEISDKAYQEYWDRPLF